MNDQEQNNRYQEYLTQFSEKDLRRWKTSELLSRYVLMTISNMAKQQSAPEKISGAEKAALALMADEVDRRIPIPT